MQESAEIVSPRFVTRGRSVTVLPFRTKLDAPRSGWATFDGYLREQGVTNPLRFALDNKHVIDPDEGSIVIETKIGPDYSMIFFPLGTESDDGKRSSSNTVYFLYDGILPVIELDSSGSVTATNTFSSGGIASRRSGSTSVFYSFDSEGNVSQRSNSSGIVLSTYLFAAHGSILSGALNEPFGYKGQFGYYTDSETGLQILTHRYYDPANGRFLTRDPIGYNGGTNLYAHGSNNPTNNIDPLGLATLHYWPGRIWYDANGNQVDKSPFGHIALQLEDGTYISYWPSKHLGPLDVGKQVEPSGNRKYLDDYYGEHQTDSLTFHIDGLDEEKIKKWWNKGKGHGKFSSGNNCADIVTQALRQGGLEPWTNNLIWSTPWDVWNGAKTAINASGKGPYIPF